MKQTRAERARQLAERLARGPSFHDIGRSFTTREASEQYRRWSECWILEELHALVPELRQSK